jgi:hypothetical protein
VRLALPALLLAAAVTAVAAAPAGRGATASACTGAALGGSFSVVRGSPAAGQITYALVLRNHSRSTCTLGALPAGTLLGRDGTRLPTRILAASTAERGAAPVVLRPGEAARAAARFSPDVPGVGESGPGRCEPRARWFSVHGPGGGTSRVPVSPQTSVCEHGRLVFTAYHRLDRPGG